ILEGPQLSGHLKVKRQPYAVINRPHVPQLLRLFAERLIGVDEGNLLGADDKGGRLLPGPGRPAAVHADHHRVENVGRAVVQANELLGKGVVCGSQRPLRPVEIDAEQAKVPPGKRVVRASSSQAGLQHALNVRPGVGVGVIGDDARLRQPPPQRQVALGEHCRALAEVLVRVAEGAAVVVRQLPERPNARVVEGGGASAERVPPSGDAGGEPPAEAVGGVQGAQAGVGEGRPGPARQRHPAHAVLVRVVAGQPEEEHPGGGGRLGGSPLWVVHRVGPSEGVHVEAVRVEPQGARSEVQPFAVVVDAGVVAPEGGRPDYLEEVRRRRLEDGNSEQEEGILPGPPSLAHCRLLLRRWSRLVKGPLNAVIHRSVVEKALLLARHHRPAALLHRALPPLRTGHEVAGHLGAAPEVAGADLHRVEHGGGAVVLADEGARHHAQRGELHLRPVHVQAEQAKVRKRLFELVEVPFEAPHTTATATTSTSEMSCQSSFNVHPSVGAVIIRGDACLRQPLPQRQLPAGELRAEAEVLGRAEAQLAIEVRLLPPLPHPVGVEVGGGSGARVAHPGGGRLQPEGAVGGVQGHQLRRRQRGRIPEATAAAGAGRVTQSAVVGGQPLVEHPGRAVGAVRRVEQVLHAQQRLANEGKEEQPLLGRLQRRPVEVDAGVAAAVGDWPDILLRVGSFRIPSSQLFSRRHLVRCHFSLFNLDRTRERYRSRRSASFCMCANFLSAIENWTSSKLRARKSSHSSPRWLNS
ncbi:hypothetical protein TYRP_009011, partial [Tyrophagus putrescentiae]